MERKPFRHPDLLPVQLLLDGLCGRISHVERTLANIPGGLAEDMRRQLGHAAYFRGLNDLQRAFEGIARSLCLIVDGSVPDAADCYGNALSQLAGRGAGRAPILSRELVEQLRGLEADPESDKLGDPDENLAEEHRWWQTALGAAPMLVDSISALDTRSWPECPGSHARRASNWICTSRPSTPVAFLTN